MTSSSWNVQNRKQKEYHAHVKLRGDYLEGTEEVI